MKDSKNILIAGAGGGFDIFSGIPIYFALKKQGKKCTIANLSFTSLNESTSKEVFPHCYKIRGGDSDKSGRNYFPEKYLKLWFAMHGENPDIYGLERLGVIPLKNAYSNLIEVHKIDTIVLVDGGTDSLMFGDEDGLGTPQEDVCSMVAVFLTGIEKQYLVNIGFGVDHFHGVSHFRFLENLAKIAREGGYLGLFQLTKEMEEAKMYIDAVNFSNSRMPGRESIVSNSIVSALEGEYGDYHRTNKTVGTELWINPLMTIYWCFELRSVIHNLKYYDFIKDVNTIAEFDAQLARYQNSLLRLREKKQIPI